MFTGKFWADLLERAVRAGAAAALGVFTASNVGHLDWRQAGIVTGTAVVVSVLTSLVASGVATPGTASLIDKPNG